MLIFIENILDGAQVAALRSVLADEACFEDGKKTAGRSAKKVKLNQQAKSELPEIKGALALVEKALRSHSVFQSAALPKSFARIMFSAYSSGMRYGAHVDDAFIANTRTDLSFTLFLSEPDSYQGGELVLQKHDGDEPIKLAAGSLVLYPSSSVHYVAEVTQGQRLAAVGWLQSRVRAAEQRETLFDLSLSLANLADTEANQKTRLHLLKAKNNLLRLWAD